MKKVILPPLTSCPPYHESYRAPYVPYYDPCDAHGQKPLYLLAFDGVRGEHEENGSWYPCSCKK